MTTPGMSELHAATSSGTRFERVIHITLVTLTFAYVILRAIHVPFIHDEAVSFFEYARPGSFQPGYSHWDAGNHLLNSLFGHLGYTLFGMSPLALRVGSVLCFLVYARYAWLFGMWVGNGLTRNLLRPALLLTPFVLDFFSLFRGYGPAIAFVMMGFYHLPRFVAAGRWQDAALSLLGVIAGGFASLSAVLLAAQALVLLVASAVLGGGSLQGRVAKASVMLVIGGALLAYLRWYGQELQSRGMLYYGTKDGLLQGTLASLSRLVLGSDAPMLLALVLLFLAASVVIASITWPRVVERRWLPLQLLSLCLVGEVIGRELLWRTQGVLFPLDRAAVHLVPLVIVVIALAIDRAVARVPAAAYFSILLAFLPLRVISHLDLQRTLLWPEESLTEELIDEIIARQAQATRPLVISSWVGFPRPLLYARNYRYPALPVLTANDHPIRHADLLLLDSLHVVDTSGFSLVWQSHDGLIRLLQRDEELALRLVADTTIRFQSTPGPFINLWEAPPREEGSAFLLDVCLRLSTEGRAPAIHLVSDAHAADGQPLHYDGLELQRVHEEWRNDTLRIARHIPGLRPDDWAGLYLWVVNGRWVGGECRIRSYAIMD